MRSSYMGLATAAIALVLAGCGASSQPAAQTTTAKRAAAIAASASATAAAGGTATQTTPAVQAAKPKVKARHTAHTKPKVAAKPKAAAKPAAKPVVHPKRAAKKPARKAPAPAPAPAARALDVSSRKLSVGTVLVTSQGRTLYTFAPDRHSMATCTGSCASVWPPLKLPAGEKPTATAGLNQSLLGSDPYPGGGRVVTYNGWPLYMFAGDSGPGTASGEGQDLNGGFWYVIAPSGAQITKK